ncbi:hypothetical protein ACOME3_002272, partial [Neoechinorhynchus agilis]
MNENYGTSIGPKNEDTNRGIVNTIIIGIVQATYETGMMIFIIHWTPIIAQGFDLSYADSNHNQIPYGLIFAAFTTSIMI